MAYAGVTAIAASKVVNGKRHIVVTVAETEARDTSEWNVDGLPMFVTLVRYKATKTAGTGTTVNPKLGRAAGWTAATQNHEGTNSTTAAHIDDQTRVRMYLSGGKLYGCSQVNSVATDHTIASELEFVEGWDNA